eukprot:2692665-Pleurochrysis_carterae.AAC.1
MLERESKREKNLEARAKELRQKEKRQSEMASNDAEKNKTPWEEQVKSIEEEFWSIVGEQEQKDGAAAENGF